MLSKCAGAINQHLQKIMNNQKWELTMNPKVKKTHLLWCQRNTFHKPRTICAPEIQSISTATFIFSKLSAWEVQLWLNYRIRSLHAKPVGWKNRKLKRVCLWKGGISCCFSEKLQGHCSTLLKKKKQKKKEVQERKPMPVFHLEEQTFLNLSFPPWISNFKKQIVTAIIKTKPLWFRQNDLPEENLHNPFSPGHWAQKWYTAGYSS